MKLSDLRLKRLLPWEPNVHYLSMNEISLPLPDCLAHYKPVKGK